MTSSTGERNTTRHLRMPGSRRKANPDGTMTIVEHLKELRRRVIISMAALLVGTVFGFIWYQVSIFGLPSLGELMRRPYCSLPEQMRISFGPDERCRLLATRPFEMFLLRLKVAAFAGIVLASPVWLYQIWEFITPGLHKKERRVTFSFVTLAVLLFVLGAILAYFVMSPGLQLLMSIGDDVQFAALTGQEYFGFLIALLVVFGVSFEVPLLIAMLNIVGLLSYDAVKDKRRYIAVGLFIFAAFMTPGQDPFSMVAMAVSLNVLVELALQFCRLNDKRRGRARPDWLDLDDEAASPLDDAPGGADAPAPISRPGPVTAPQPVRDPLQRGPATDRSWTDPESASGETGYSDVL